MPTPDPHPMDREELRDRVATELEAWLSDLESVLVEVDPDCRALAERIRALLSGGKRLRAGFCYWAWRGTGRAGEESIVTAAAALELVQAAALLHDDIMDASDTRRGLPSAHRAIEAVHRARDWRGCSAKFGESAALLAGDLCLTASAQFVHRAIADLDPATARRGLAVYDDMLVQLMAGQYLDLLVGVRPPAADPEAMARRVIRYKTVNYTVARPLRLGGTLARADSDLLRAYDAYAAGVGEAFQLRDDVLGVFGDPDQTGKPTGDDLREGKQTLLVTLARSAATPAEQSLLGRVGAADLSPGEIAEITSVLAGPALTEVERRIDLLADQARQAVEAARLDPVAREVLLELVDTATRRSV